MPVWVPLPILAAAEYRSGSSAVHQGCRQQRCRCLQQEGSFEALQGRPEQRLVSLLFLAPAVPTVQQQATEMAGLDCLHEFNDPLCVTDTQPAVLASTNEAAQCTAQQLGCSHNNKKPCQGAHPLQMSTALHQAAAHPA